MLKGFEGREGRQSLGLQVIKGEEAPMEGGVYTDDPQELTSQSVLRRDIPWDIYKSARFISDRELQLIKRYDKKDASYQAKLLDEVPCSLCLSGPAAWL